MLKHVSDLADQKPPTQPRRAALGLGLCLVLLAGCSTQHAPDPAKVSKTLQGTLEQSPPDYLKTNTAAHKALTGFYKNRDYQPAWIDGLTPQDSTQDLLAQLAKADEHGLLPKDYAAQELAERVNNLKSNAQAVATLDLRLSYAFMDFAQDLHAGRIDPKTVDPLWVTEVTSLDYVDVLKNALADDQVAEALEKMAPPQAGYQQLKTALIEYRRTVKDASWPKVSTGDVIELGDTSPRVVALRKRLAASDELGDASAADSANANVYDETLAEAVQQFQRKYGRAVDGLLGPGTVQALNVSPQQRVREIEINMERWRWLPAELGTRHIIVNVPNFSLMAYADDEPSLGMNVIVGNEYNDRATPIFTDTMQYLVFRPYWGIPHSITSEEILPKARKDPDYLAQKNYEIVSNYRADATVFPTNTENLDKVASEEYRLRERPGPSNSLGLVKFLFPNQFAVYLHDTPADHLFEKDLRAFSHGCIRVEQPAELAQWVLNNNDDWDLAQVEEAMHGSDRQRVQLDSPIPVYILYWTAFISEDGELRFRPDLYSHDEKLDKALSQSAS